MIRVGVIGAGAWGKNHVRTFASLANAELRAVADGTEDVRARVKDQYPNVEVFADGADVIEDDRIDAVVIATPAPTHAALAQLALSANKHVLVEKPIALTAIEAQMLQDFAVEKDRVLMVGHLMLYHSAIERLREMIDDGTLGDPLYLYGERVNLGVIRPDENAMWSLGPHDLAVADYLLGVPAVDVSARGAVYLQPGVHDVVFANVAYEQGRMANIHTSWLDPRKSRRIVVVGTKQMAVFDDMEAQEKLRIYDKGAELRPKAVGYGEFLSVRSGDVLIPRIQLKEPLKNEASHFISCIENGETPRSGGAHAVRVVQQLEAAQRSLESGGQRVEIDSVGVTS